MHLINNNVNIIPSRTSDEKEQEQYEAAFSLLPLNQQSLLSSSWQGYQSNQIALTAKLPN